MEKIGAAVVTAKSKERHIYFSCRGVSMDQENDPGAQSAKMAK
jgi:hypothetical protein